MTIFGIVLFAALIGAVAALIIGLMLIQCWQRLKTLNAQNVRQLEYIKHLQAEISDMANSVEELHTKFFAVLGDAPQSTSRNARHGATWFDPWDAVSE